MLEKVKLIQHQINLVLTEEMEIKSKYGKQNFFESTNKVGKCLAYKLRKERTKNIIQSLKNTEGKEVNNLKKFRK